MVSRALKAVGTGMADDPLGASCQFTLRTQIFGGRYMKPRHEGTILELLGLLVMIGTAVEIRSAGQQFTWAMNQTKNLGQMDIVWPVAMEVFAGFLFLAGAAAMISGHVLRVMSGVKHRGWMWKAAGLFCCLAGMVAILEKMALVAMSRSGHSSYSIMNQADDFISMLTNGGFAIAMYGGYVFLLGIMLLMADRLGTRLRSANAAEAQHGP
jgi:hypothetical protein